MFKEMLDNVREKKPLIHNITNYVTVNDCANVLLACGASPIMADDIGEVSDITSICGGLNINIGTLNKDTIPSMFAAGKKASELAHPIVLDPVGAGASSLRTDTANKLIDELDITVIRGNISEIKALALGEGNTHGVDADVADAITEDNLDNVISFAKTFAEKTGDIIAITGAVDIIADAETVFVVKNGHPDLSRITGSGCQLSALVAAFITANPNNALKATAAAVVTMGLCGEKAHDRMNALDGNSTYRNYLIDAIFNLTGEELDKGAKYEMQ